MIIIIIILLLFVEPCFVQTECVASILERTRCRTRITLAHMLSFSQFSSVIQATPNAVSKFFLYFPVHVLNFTAQANLAFQPLTHDARTHAHTHTHTRTHAHTHTHTHTHTHVRTHVKIVAKHQTYVLISSARNTTANK